MTATQTSAFPLPGGFDDPDSTFWIEPDLRDYYQRAEAPPDQLEAAIEARRQELTDADILAKWEAWRASREAKLSQSEYRRWLQANTRGGHPTRYSLSTARDRETDFVREGARRPLGALEYVTIVHRMQRRAAESLLGREHSATGQAQRAARKKVCTICGAQDKTVASRGSDFGAEVCDSCEQLRPLVQAALTPVGGDGQTNRFAAIAAHLSATGGALPAVELTDELVEAWIDDPNSNTLWEFAAARDGEGKGPEKRTNPSGLLGRLRGGKGS